MLNFHPTTPCVLKATHFNLKNTFLQKKNSLDNGFENRFKSKESTTALTFFYNYLDNALFLLS